MRVALVSEWLDAWRGGAETSTLQFMHRLMDAGIEVHVFTRSRPSPAPGLNVCSIPGASMSRTRQSATFAHRVQRRLSAGQFDVVHAISPCRFADIYQPRGGTVAETVERNVALRNPGPARSFKRLANHLNLKQRYLLRLERQLFGSADGPTVVAISDYVARQLSLHYSLPGERIRRIYNGVEADPTPPAERADQRQALRREFGVADGDLLVLTVAHNFRLKGVQRWMEALQFLRGRKAHDVRALVVGRGDSPQWHRQAQRMGITDVLTFVGPSDRVRSLYHAADCLMHPTYYDPCSRVVLEAMVAGLPCVTTRWDGAAEMIVDDVSGLIVDDPDDVVALAAGIEKLRDPRIRRAMGAAAARIADQVSMKRHAHAMIEVYEEIAARRRQGLRSA